MENCTDNDDKPVRNGKKDNDRVVTKLMMIMVMHGMIRTWPWTWTEGNKGKIRWYYYYCRWVLVVHFDCCS